MRKGTRCVSAPLLAVCLGLAVLVPSAGGADEGAAPGGVPAALELYALEAELVAARARVEALAAERAEVAAERADARARLLSAKAVLAVVHRRLAGLVRSIYAAGEPEPLAVVLGAQSLDEAQAGLDVLERAAVQSRAVGRRARSAVLAVERLARTLAGRERSLAALESAARERTDALEEVVDRRRAYLAAVSRRAGQAAAAAARRQAATAQRRSEALTAAARPAGTPQHASPAAVEDASLAVRTVRRLTVDAVAYSLPGRTASGLPVGRGVAAVDPAVIPLGTRMHVPGYGTAIAADVGMAVRGLVIDLWFPTLAEARAWGRRTVTVTVL